MKIGETTYNFAFTVGASCDKEEQMVHKMTHSKSLVAMALIMNKAHEDREKFYNPDYEPNYLTRDLLLVQKADIIPALDRELAEVYNRDCKITVETSPVKKKTGAERG